MSVRRSLWLSFAQTYTEILLQFGSSLILARILTPNDIGLFSVVAALLMIGHFIRDFGISRYLVKEFALTSEKIGAATVVVYSISWSMALLLFSLSGWLATFYKEPVIEDIGKIMSLNFVLIPFGSIIMNVLHRNMNFSAIYIVKTCSALAHAITAISLGLAGFGALSMAWAAVVGVMTSFLVAQCYRHHVPRAIIRWSEIRLALGFGSKNSTGLIMETVCRSAPEMFLGKLASMESVGFFSRAAGVVALFERGVAVAIKPVVLPHLAELQRNGSKLKTPYLKGMQCFQAISWPFYLSLAFMAEPVIDFLFGSQWQASIPVLQALCLGAMLADLVPFWSDLAIALDRVKSFVFVQFINLILVISIMSQAGHVSLYEIALWLALRQGFIFVLCQRYVLRHLNVCLRDHWYAMRLNIPLAVLTSLPAMLVNYSGWIGDVADGIALTAVLISSAALWVVIIIISKHPFSGEILLLVQSIRKKQQQLTHAIKRRV